VQYDLSESAAAAGEAALAARDATPAGLGAAILELLDDPARRETMSVTGRTRANRDFRWESEEAALLAAYEALFE
jgi:glycosyltransferase involved in cell wall biosynthesis